MKPFLFIFLSLFISFASFSQEQCETPDDSIADPNSITKCSVEDVKDALSNMNTKQITVQKKSIKKRNKKNILSINNNNSHELNTLKQNNELINSLTLKNDVVSSIKKIPFFLVEQIPLFPKCKNSPLLQQAKCFEKQMARHIISNFNYPKAAFKKRIEGRILLQFIINEQGNVVNIKNKGPEGTGLLKQEAVRLISKLPKFTPGKHNGKIVKVKYGLPITFKLPSEKKSNS